MNAKAFKAYIDYTEMRYPGIEFLMPVEGDTMSRNFCALIGQVMHEGELMLGCVMLPDPSATIVLPGFSKAEKPPLEAKKMPKDFNL